MARPAHQPAPDQLLVEPRLPRPGEVQLLHPQPQYHRVLPVLKSLRRDSAGDIPGIHIMQKWHQNQRKALKTYLSGL